MFEVEIQNENPLNYRLIKIKYKLKNIDLSTLENIINYIFMYKSKIWKHEKEVRIIIDDLDEDVYFKFFKLKSIYLGEKFSSNKQDIKVKFKDLAINYKDIKFYKTNLDIINQKIVYQELSIDEFRKL